MSKEWTVALHVASYSSVFEGGYYATINWFYSGTHMSKCGLAQSGAV